MKADPEHDYIFQTLKQNIILTYISPLFNVILIWQIILEATVLTIHIQLHVSGQETTFFCATSLTTFLCGVSLLL